jgi:hypothetical protein
MASYRQRYNRQKSPHKRFLFVLGIIFSLSYMVLGSLLIFNNRLPLPINRNGRLAMGGILIVYGIIRGVRVIQQGKDLNEN